MDYNNLCASGPAPADRHYPTPAHLSQHSEGNSYKSSCRVLPAGQDLILI
jgi:hypothetical protein